MYDRATSDRPYGSFASANAFRSSAIENRLWCVCMPEPLIPWIGLGMNVAYRPCCCAIALSANLKVIALSAVLQRVRVLEVDLVLAGGDLVVGRLDPDPERLEGVDHVLADLLGEVGREVEVAGLVVRQRRDLAVLAAPEEEELELGAGVDDVAQLPGPLDLAAQHVARIADERLAARRETSQITRAVPRGPVAGCHGISANVAMSGMRYWSDSAIRVKPSIESRRTRSRGAPSLELVDRDRHGLDVADDVGELELDEADAALLRVGDPVDSCDFFVGDDHRCRSSARPVLASRGSCRSTIPRRVPGCGQDSGRVGRGGRRNVRPNLVQIAQV